MYVKISASSQYHPVHVLQYVDDYYTIVYVQCQIGTIRSCYIGCAGGTKSLKYKVRHFSSLNSEGMTLHWSQSVLAELCRWDVPLR